MNKDLAKDIKKRLGQIKTVQGDYKSELKTQFLSWIDGIATGVLLSSNQDK